ncbi:divalent-cation tolerance protein CutA [Methanoregula sp.]|uniref:divalent-cation tolerance protein CutA n=1 Tax=Methanoregula sp. TaxID=2052170 RepID=UPI000CC56BEE|nr:divalent-cation tolerance protein CutA [Methanoregula sp.]PKG33685.1 MAG: divalent-cation tolerance protein CutA [Methanoregula sp.]
MEKNEADLQEICVIWSTVPLSRSEDISKRLLEKDLVACVNITPVRSLYRWKGEACDDEEHLLIMKTRRSLADAVIRALKSMHPYEVPEIIVLPVIAGHLPYLAWVLEETRGP